MMDFQTFPGSELLESVLLGSLGSIWCGSLSVISWVTYYHLCISKHPQLFKENLSLF